MPTLVREFSMISRICDPVKGHATAPRASLATRRHLIGCAPRNSGLMKLLSRCAGRTRAPLAPEARLAPKALSAPLAPKAPQAPRSKATIPLAATLIIAIAALVFWLGSRDRNPPPDLRPTAAVLPFEANMIGGDNDNYSALMTEAITTELARLGTISVASFTSAMQFAGQRPSMSEVNTTLKSRYVIEASVDDEASEILVVARIVNAETNRKMWVSDYRGARDDVRGIAQRIAYDVSSAILVRESTR